MRPPLVLAAVLLLAGCGEENPARPSTPPAGAAAVGDRVLVDREVPAAFARLAAPVDEAEVLRWIEALEAHARAHPGEKMPVAGGDIVLKGLVEAKFRFLESDLPVPAPTGTPGITSLAERDFLQGLLSRYRAVAPRDVAPGATGPDGR
ncbi:MAG: hypothetical protein AB7T63_14545 [Planctomycetota bacterium]